jgi:nucleoid DNA-binding protein
LIDEIIAELKSGGSVNILGFGKFELVELKERIVVSVNDGEQKRTKQSRALRFRLSAAFKRLLAFEDKI